MMLEDRLVETLRTIGEDFQENELAYLALTGKVENPFRDRLAFKLHRNLSPEVVVAKEWRRVDIAILRSEVPLALIELKAMYTFDPLIRGDKEKFMKGLEGGIARYEKLAFTETAMYGLFLATHPRQEIQKPDGESWVIKYRHDINRAIQRDGGVETVQRKCRETVESYFHGKGTEIKYVTLRGGRAFGTDVDVDCWFVGPM